MNLTLFKSYYTRFPITITMILFFSFATIRLAIIFSKKKKTEAV